MEPLAQVWYALGTLNASEQARIPALKAKLSSALQGPRDMNGLSCLATNEADRCAVTVYFRLSGVFRPVEPGSKLRL